MAGPTRPVEVVGDAAADHPLPPAPTDPAAVVCRCMGVTVGDLDEAWAPGYTELELLKRATPRRHRARARAAPACRTSGPGSPRATGVDARAVHGPARRPPDHPRARRPPTPRSTPSGGPPLHDEHLALGARWTASAAGGGRGTTATRVAEYWAVREARLDRRRQHARQARRQRPGRRRGPRADLPVPRRGHPARPLALRAAAQRARPRHGRRDDPARVGDAVRADVHERRRRERRDVAARLDRHVGPPRPRHGPDDVARRDQRHGAARRGAAGPARPGGPAALPRPRPRRGRRRPVPRRCACRSPARRPGSCTTRSTARSSCGGR